MFKISFRKEVSKDVYEIRTLYLGLLKADLILPILSIKALYELVAYNSNPYPSLPHFTNLYNLFVRDPQNSKFILDGKYITFGRGGHKKISLDGDGLRAFCQKYQYNFQLSHNSLSNLGKAIMEELQNIENSGSIMFNKSKMPLQSDIYSNILLEFVKEDSNNFLHIELECLLLSRNFFYIMELENLYFRAGYTSNYLRNRLRNHPVYNSPNFLQFHTLFKFKESCWLDCATLENDFFLKSYVIGLKKEEIQRCKVTNDFCFKVSDRRDIENMLNLCLTNPNINYSGLIEPITNIALLNLLGKRKRNKSE